MQGCRLIIFLTSLSLLLTTTVVEAAHNPNQQPNDDNLLVLGLKVDYLNLDELIPAYRIDTEIYLPLGMLSQILDIAIKVELGTASAGGFIIKEERQFHLDVGRLEITLNGKTETFPEHQVYVYPDDIYINSRLLEKWWPMKFDVNLFTSQLLIKTLEPLPFQKRLLREIEIEKIRNKYKASKRNYPPVESQYSLITPPFIDQRLSAHYVKTPNSNTAKTYNYTTHLKADLLYHETSLFVSGNSEEDNSDVVITASRIDPEGRLLGPMGATQYSMLHVSTPTIDFISANKSGIAGATISNYPLQQQTHFDKHSFEGELLPDWEVELYHNNALIAYQEKPQNGKYRFADIPLLFGHNYFKLIFYGPLGQTHEETHTFSLTGALVQPGSYYYKIAFAEEDDSENQRSFFTQDIGINKYLSTQLNFVSIPIENINSTEDIEEQHKYGNFILNGFWGPLFYRYNYVTELDGGKVREISLQNRLGRSNLSASVARFDDFTSEQFQSTDPLAQRTKYRFDTVIPAWWLPTMPITLEVIKDEHESGNERTQYTGRISASTRGLAVTNSLTRVESTTSETIENGVLQISTHSYNFALRSELYYQNKPDSRLNTIAMNFSGRYLHPYQFNIGVTKHADDELSYLLGLNKQFGNYALLTNASYKTDGQWSLDLAFAISLGRDPRMHRWHTQALPLAANGSASVLVFFDKNQNGIQDEGEDGLENVGFRFNDSIKNTRTDKNGVILFTDLPAHRPIDLGIDISTLEDPLMVPLKPGIRITARAGHIEQINLPVIQTGEIDGTIYLHKDGKNIPVGNIEMELTDTSGKFIQKIKSAYDGFYIMSKIPAGKYLITLAPEEAAKQGLKEVVPREIAIQAENPFISGVNFVLYKDDGKQDKIEDLKPD